MDLARFSAPDQAAKTVDPDGAVGPNRGPETAYGGAVQKLCSNVILGIKWRAAVEPFVEIELERLFQERDLLKPGTVEQIDELAAGQVRGMRLVACPLNSFMVPGRFGVGIGQVVADHQRSARRSRCTWRATKASGSITWWTT